ncbi:hypothetical protein ACTFIW_006286 [Dictyostelium discoideum]
MKIYSIKYFPSENESTSPLLVLFGFIGSTEKVLDKYKSIWKGFNILVFTPPCDMTIILMRICSKKVLSKIHNFFQTHPNAPKSLYIQGLSVGACFVPGHLKQYENEKYSYLLSYIDGIVLDSGLSVGLKDAITGFKCAMRTQISSVGVLIQHFVPLFKPFIGEYCRNDVPCIYKNGYNFLIIYSDCDTYFPGASKKLIKRIHDTDLRIGAQPNKRILHEVKFDSNHIEHLKTHKQEYTKALTLFISKTQSNLKSKP